MTDVIWSAADGTPLFRIPDGMAVRRMGSMLNGWVTASCTKCGWDVDSRNDRDWMRHTAIHACGAPTGDADESAADDVPGIGAPVHYRSYGTPNGEYTPQCRAAIVTHVGITGDPPATRNAVTLTVFNPDGLFLKANIPFDPVHKSGGTWHWPHA